MDSTLVEGSSEQSLGSLLVALQDQLRVAGRSVVQPVEKSAGLEHKLVGAVAGVLEKHELVLVREVQRASRVGLQAEMEGLDTSSAVLGGDGEFNRDEL